jgi:single-strand DNA-binding protein
MAGDLNRCEFIGRLGRDVELKDMKNGEQVATFSIAVGESYLNKQGERVKKTEWINVVAYRKLADICSKFLTKGSQVFIAGKLNTNKYMGKDGTEKLSVQIILDEMKMLGSKSNQDEAASSQDSPGKQVIDDFDTLDIPF